MTDASAVLFRFGNVMAQSDFATLAIKHELSEESQKLKDLTIAKKEGEISYVPVNIIPEEVSAFIAAWEVSTLTTMSPSWDMSFDSALVPYSQDRFEPARRLNDFAPPKRFYRRFWSSLSRRILAFSSTHN